MKTYLAEVLGTFLLVFIGTASVVTGGFGGALPLGQEGIGLAFGIGLIAAAYAIGPDLRRASQSGGHARRLPCRPAAGQGRHSLLDRADHRRHPGLAGVVDHRVAARLGATPRALAPNGWDPAKWGRHSAFLAELIGTFTFVTVILGVTAKSTPPHLPGWSSA